MKDLIPYIFGLRQRVMAAFHRPDPLKATSDERQKRWTEVIAEHRKPFQPKKDSEQTTPPQA